MVILASAIIVKSIPYLVIIVLAIYGAFSLIQEAKARWFPKKLWKNKYKISITKNNGEKLPPDEPLFFFRGQDMFSPLVLAFYIGLLTQAGKPPNYPVIQDTYKAMADMNKWPVKKFPD